jgi:hypothetical protein
MKRIHITATVIVGLQTWVGYRHISAASGCTQKDDLATELQTGSPLQSKLSMSGMHVHTRYTMHTVSQKDRPCRDGSAAQTCAQLLHVK